MESRDTFIFYRSIFESAKVLSEKERLKFYDAVIQFSLDFNEPDLDGVSAALFVLVRPTLDKSNKGYIAGKKRKPIKDPAKVGSKVPPNNKDKDKDKDKDIRAFTFNLPKKYSLENTSAEYRTKLEAHIQDSGKQMTYKQFYDTCVMKDYKYKNFQMAYNKWTEDEKKVDTRKPKMIIGGTVL